MLYRRIADGRGWALSEHSKGKQPCMEEVAGELVELTSLLSEPCGESDAGLTKMGTESEPTSAVGPRNFETVFAGAGQMEGYLMKQRWFMSRWHACYFRLDDGILSYHESKSLAGTRNKKVLLELTGHSVTCFTNYKYCFNVRTGKSGCFLLAKDSKDMAKWKTAIDAQIYQLFMNDFTPPEDNYWGQGTQGRFFCSIPETGTSQWIYTHPVKGAPRTGGGIFPMEVIEVTQLLPVEDMLFLRIANGQGWAVGRHSKDGQPCMEKVDAPNELVEANSVDELSRNKSPETPVLRNASLLCEPTGM